MRSSVISTFALAAALVPAMVFAQATGTQPPASQAQASGSGSGGASAAPKIPFTTPAGMLLVQIKPDKTADFEEMVTKLRAGLATTTDDTLKKQAAGLKVYKSSEPFGPNTLYVVLLDPAVPNSEYELFHMLLATMTPEQKAAPDAQATFNRYAAAFASQLSKLSLTPLGGS